MKPVILTIEKSQDNKDVWGSVLYDDKLLVDSAKTLDVLEKKFRRLPHDFHNVNPKTSHLNYILETSFVPDKTI